MKCLYVVNNSSGNIGKIDIALVESKLIEKYGTVSSVVFDTEDGFFDIDKRIEGFDCLAVSGGDGTLNHALNVARKRNLPLIFIPSGTINDNAKTRKIKLRDTLSNLSEYQNIDIGKVDNTVFSYVAAAGSFTPIGYLPRSKYKKIFKKIVYYLYAVKEYKIHNLKMSLLVDGVPYSGEYTLVMALKSRCCFNFCFNNLYKGNNGQGELLLIRTPKGMFRLIKLFFRCFRAFFVGFQKEYHSKNIDFFSFRDIDINIEETTNFCVDGEKLIVHKGKHEIRIEKY